MPASDVSNPPLKLHVSSIMNTLRYMKHKQNQVITPLKGERSKLNTEITASGGDICLVGQLTAESRAQLRPSPAI